MTSPIPRPAPKKLERSRSNRVVGGVCGGIANYLNMDPTLVRVLTVVLSLFTGVPIVIYIVLLFVVPEEQEPTSLPPTGPRATDPVWGSAGAPWEQPAPTQPPAQPAQPPRPEAESGQPDGRPDGNPLR